MDFVSFAKRHIISKAYDQYIPLYNFLLELVRDLVGVFLFF
jgi:hypothetical protein